MDVMTLAAKLTLDTSGFDSGLASSEGKMKGFGSNGSGILSGIWNFAKKAVSAAKQVGEQVVQVGMDFDSTMSQVKALGNLNDTDFVKIRQKAIDLGASTKFTAEEVGEAFSYMALAGWDADEMLQGIEGVLNLAAASGEDLGRTSDIVTDALTAFGLEAKDVTHFVDVLAAASTNSNTTVSQMGEAFKYLATTGGMLGYSIDDVAIGLGLLANNGIKSSQAGTSLRRIITSLINPSQDAEEAMNKLGISLFEAGTDKVKPFKQVMTELRDVLKNSNFNLEGQDLDETIAKMDELNEQYDAYVEELKEKGQVDVGGQIFSKQDALDEWYEQKTREIANFNEEFLGAIADIGGTRGISALLALMKTTDEDFDKLTKAVDNSEGAASKMAKTMLDNLQGDITILNSAIEGLQIIVSDSFTQQLRSFVQTLTAEIGELNKAFQDNGVVGMFTNLADWVINGVEDVLSNPDLDQINKFGEAIGKFLGKTAKKLITNLPTYLQGIVDIGNSIALGLAEGLLSGFFGEDSEVQRLVEGLENELNGVEVNNVKAQGLLNYLAELAAKGDENVTKTEAWKTAVSELEQIMPGVKEQLEAEGPTLQENIDKVRTMTDEIRKQAIQQAMVNTLQKEYELLAQQGVEREKETVNIGMAEGRQKAVTDTFMDSIQQYAQYIKQGIEGGELFDFDDSRLQAVNDLLNGYVTVGNDRIALSDLDADQLAAVLQDLQTYLGPDSELWKIDQSFISPDEVNSLKNEYDMAVKEVEQSNKKIAEINKEMEATKTEISTTEKAVQKISADLGVTATGVETSGANVVTALDNLAGSLEGSEYDGSHAKGLWDVPYDDYVAKLHRGEMVLTAAQARSYRNGDNAFDISAFADAIMQAVMTGMSNANVNAFVTDREVSKGNNRWNGQRIDAGRYTSW